MVRVRFAPSPTGELHIGGARTALYNFLFARQHQGQFVIRIEDTDQTRLVEGSLERILNGLKWLGLSWDEGPDVGGKYGPYVQSDRTKLYKAYASELIAKGAAYYCFCSAERLTELRTQQQSNSLPTRYDGKCANLSHRAITAKINRAEVNVVRLRIPAGHTEFNDIVRGPMTIANKTVDEQVLLKSDGYPTYHLANVVDDHLMQISHIIRGEEWLPSTVKHIIIYQALGWDIPKFAHLSNVLNANRAKLSKRKDGASVWLATYIEQGYLPAALVNFLALLGWHPVDNQEIFSTADLIKTFNLERVQKAGAIFDITKLNWFNSAYIKNLPVLELNNLLKPFYLKLGQQYGCGRQDTINLTQILQPRLVILGDVNNSAVWFFKADAAPSSGLLIPPDGSAGKTLIAIQTMLNSTAALGEWSLSNIQKRLEQIKQANQFTNQEFLWPVRVALSGEKQSPDVPSLLFALGQEEATRRLTMAHGVLS
ncbi:MAG: glutamate--tRNA ligase [Patescibacteria group bacterium]